MGDKSNVRRTDVAGDQSSALLRRTRFFSDSLRLSSSRACLAARLGRVFLRALGMTSARRTTSARRVSASSRFCSWLRVSLATTRSSPSSLKREARRVMRRARSSSLNACEAVTFHVISTRVDVLLTCWPPAPDARVARTPSSARGIASLSFTRSARSSSPSAAEDLVAIEAAVLDEYAGRVSASNDATSHVYAGHVGLERVGIHRRTFGIRLQLDTKPPKEREVRAKSRKCVHTIRVQCLLQSVGIAYDHGALFDSQHGCAKPRRDLASGEIS